MPGDLALAAELHPAATTVERISPSNEPDRSPKKSSVLVGYPRCRHLEKSDSVPIEFVTSIFPSS